LAGGAGAGGLLSSRSGAYSPGDCHRRSVRQLLRLFADPHFARAAWNNAVYAGWDDRGRASVSPSAWRWPLPRIDAAQRVVAHARGDALLIPLVAAAALFTFILAPGEGLLRFLPCSKVGIGLAIKSGSATRNYALAAVIAITVWKNTGYYMLFFYRRARRGVAGPCRRGKIDGAGPWRRLRSVILPMLGPTFGFVRADRRC